MARTFTFKPSPVFAPVEISVSDTHVTAGRQGQPARDAAFDALDRVRYWRITSRGVVSEGLALESPGVQTVRIEFGDNGMRGEGANASAFREAVATILETLAARRPDLKVTVSASLGATIAMFVIGLALALMSGLLGLVFLFDQGIGDGFFAALSLLVVSGLGAMMAWSFRPWQTPPEVDADLLAAYFAGTLEDYVRARAGRAEPA